MNPTDGVTQTEIDALNPLEVLGNDPELVRQLSTPGGVISRVLSFAFPMAGFILFVMLVWGGFEILTEAKNQKMENGKKRITAAVMGFLMLFISYWIIQIVFLVFGVENTIFA